MQWQNANYGAPNGYASYPEYQPPRDSIPRNSVQNNVPQSPGSSSTGNEDEDHIRISTKQPDPTCHVYDGRIYAMKVIQQPIRARMCGFGDKDRRPVSSPPILQLYILDAETKEEIDYTDNSLEMSHFVCQVDIYSRDGQVPKNILRSTQGQGSISMTTTSDYPVTQIANPPGTHAQRLPVTDAAHRTIHGPYASPYDQALSQTTWGSYPTGPYGYPERFINGAPSNGPFPPAVGPPRAPDYYYPNAAPNPYEDTSRYGPPAHHGSSYQPHRTSSSTSYAASSDGGQYNYRPQGGPPPNAYADPAQAMHAGFQPRGGPPPTPPADAPPTTGAGPKVDRNLIGTLCTSALLLKDLEDKDGIFFVWGDLSVRTEDWFSLKFSFFNVSGVLRSESFAEVTARAKTACSYPSEPPKEGTAKSEKALNGIRAPLIAETAPCLATCFSQCFKVFSAKKFPGVVESTALNAHFAKQGVKITVRSDKELTGKRKRGECGDDDDDDD